MPPHSKISPKAFSILRDVGVFLAVLSLAAGLSYWGANIMGGIRALVLSVLIVIAIKWFMPTHPKQDDQTTLKGMFKKNTRIPTYFSGSYTLGLFLSSSAEAEAVEFSSIIIPGHLQAFLGSLWIFLPLIFQRFFSAVPKKQNT